MHDTSAAALLWVAASLGVMHTLLGPDHYIPFVAMARAGRWSLRKTLAITVVCGVGHVLASILLGCVGIAMGLAIGGLEMLESMRGQVAGWLLLGFGLAYTAWGLHRAARNRPHTHAHVHADGTTHRHDHAHVEDHTHVHANGNERTVLTGWMLFTIFVFGPCEVLIPVLMYPAAEHSWPVVALVAIVFALATIATMTAAVAAGYLGVSSLAPRGMQRYAHALAGMALTLCGLAIQLGL